MPAPARVDSSAVPDAVLRTARESMGLGRPYVARSLNLSVDLVEALEEGNHDRLPSPVFVRAYLDAYARLLGQAPEPLRLAWESAHPWTARPAFTIPQSHARAGQQRALSGLLLAIFALGLGLLIGSEWNRSRLPVHAPPVVATAPTQPARISQPAAPPALMAPPVSVATPTPDTPAQLAEVPSVGAAMRESSETPVASPQAVPQTAATPAQPTGEGPLRLVLAPATPRLEFIADSWVDIRDAKDAQSLAGLIPAGTIQYLGGTPPWSFVLGNSPGVRITYQGRPFDQSRYNRGRVARFTLGTKADAPATPAIP
jgi:cytoskeleton protein RodZ